MPMTTAPAPIASGTAVLLVNLGTPQAPTPGAVRRYLAQFLSDPYVVQIPRLVWWPLLHGLVLPLRSARVARKYAGIWMEGGSPLAVHTQRLAARLQGRWPEVLVDPAMRYAEPARDARRRALAGAGVERLLVLPLYPQYSSTTTGTVAALVERERGPMQARVVEDYATDPGWVDAVAASIRAHWAAHGRGQRLLFSFHGLPQRLVDGGGAGRDRPSRAGGRGPRGRMRGLAVELPGGTVRGLRWGEAGRPPVLALHGWLDNAASFVPLAAHLEGIELVAIDLPGHGRSAHLPPGADYSFAAAVHLVLDVADALGWERFALLGHSMGAGISSLVAAACPERVRRLVAIEALGALPDTPENTVPRLRQAVASTRALRGKRLRAFPDLETAVRARMMARVGAMEEAAARLLVERGTRPVALDGGGSGWE